MEQRDAIRKMNEKTQLLKQELSIEYRESREVLSPNLVIKLKVLQQQSAMYTRKIGQEKKHVLHLEALLESKTASLASKRQSTGSLDEKRDNATANFRRMQGLENRLENALVKKNEVESECKTFLGTLESVRGILDLFIYKYEVDAI